jgi:acetyl-CoA carboxylase biotin carboxyl carrier protein
VEYKQIKKLMDDMGESKLTSIDIEFPDGIKIKMKKENKDTVVIKEEIKPAVNNVVEVKNNIEEKRETQKQEEEVSYITSPMVGTFYAKPSPTAKNFVEVGSRVKKGDTLCIIEAMKLMNEIEAEQEGEIIEILVKDAEPVDFGKKLFKIK